MGRMNLVLANDVEIAFRNAIPGKKKGDISKKIEYLIRKDLSLDIKEIKKEFKILEDLSKDMTKIILRFYNSEKFSILAANEVALEWDKLKQKYNLK